MITHYMSRKGLTQTQLAEKMGIKPSSVNQWLTGRTKPGRENLTKLSQALDVSISDLLEPRIINETSEEPGVYVTGNIRSARPVISEFYTHVPFLSARAQAGLPHVSYEYTDLKWIDETYPVFMPIVTINERHIVIEISGDSMEPSIRSGALVLAEHITGNNWQYESNAVYAVLYGPGRFVVKRIKSNDLATEGVLCLHSDNPMHGPITVQGKEIHCMWKVLRKVDEAIR